MPSNIKWYLHNRTWIHTLAEHKCIKWFSDKQAYYVMASKDSLSAQDYVEHFKKVCPHRKIDQESTSDETSSNGTKVSRILNCSTSPSKGPQKPVPEIIRQLQGHQALWNSLGLLGPSLQKDVRRRSKGSSRPCGSCGRWWPSHRADRRCQVRTQSL